MILFKNGVCQITAKKQKNGLYVITQKTKRVWGRMYEEKILASDISPENLEKIKTKLLNL